MPQVNELKFDDVIGALENATYVSVAVKLWEIESVNSTKDSDEDCGTVVCIDPHNNDTMVFNIAKDFGSHSSNKVLVLCEVDFSS